MTEFLAALQAMGPFTTPLCVGMGYAIYWLAGQVREVRAENRGLLLQRATDQAEDATAYAEYGETMRNVIRDNAQAIERFNLRAEAILARTAG